MSAVQPIMTAPLTGWLERVRLRTDDRLRSVLDERDARMPPRLREAMHYACFSGGKRLRPALIAASAQAAGDHDPIENTDVLHVSAAYEMIHAHSLVLDDLPSMDDDDLRRGKPTVHKVYGEATAILGGNALLVLAYELLSSRIKPPRTAARLVADLSAHIGRWGIIAGQHYDLHPHECPSSLETVRQVHGLKTASFLRACCRAGAMVAGGSRPLIERLGSFGYRLGLAYQAIDDLLDETGVEQEAGKRVRKDRARGKLTLPAMVGVEPARRIAAEQAETALQLLTPLGDAAEPLRGLASMVLDRRR